MKKIANGNIEVFLNFIEANTSFKVQHLRGNLYLVKNDKIKFVMHFKRNGDLKEFNMKTANECLIDAKEISDLSTIMAGCKLQMGAE